MKISRYLRTFLFAAMLTAIPASSYAGIFLGISIGVAPPPLPVYSQPPLPAEGYMWTPGYWAWGSDGYFWVPGTWVQPPSVGLLWTPGYWGWNNGAYAFNAGYWGPHIGFYGGVNYGFGFGGVGFEGGYWQGGHFAYNSAVNNVSNVHVTNVYNKTVINNTTINNNRTSFNGGTGGIQAQPTAQERAAVSEHHVEPTAAQVQHVNTAQSNPQLRASENGGKPAIAATARPGDFKSAVPARAAGGQVNPAVYKAAAANNGKLPAGMKDPGATPANHAAPAAAANRPAAADANRPAAVTANRPAAEASRPATTNRPAPIEAARPAAEPARPAAAPARPAAQPAARPAAEPKPAAKPQQHSQPKHEEKPKR